MSESIILVAVGGFLGIIGTVVGTLVNYRLRQEERKSDRRQEVYERELSVVRDLVDALVEAMDRIEWWAHIETKVGPGARAELGKEAYLLTGKANLVALSLNDQELMKGCSKLLQGFNRWSDLLDSDTGKAKEGREEEYKELRDEIRRIGSEVRQRTREILEEI